MVTFLFSFGPTFGKITCYGSDDDCCGGSGKNKQYVTYCLDSSCSQGGNCKIYFDPAFPSFENKSSATAYIIGKYEMVLLLTIISFFFALLSVLKERLFALDFMSKIFKIRPQIIQTKCKYYNSYWVRKFKNYL
jgi:hypothetical protein